MAELPGQAGAIEITEEMARVGADELVRGLDPDGDVHVPLGPYSARALAKAIFMKMSDQQRGAQRSPLR